MNRGVSHRGLSGGVPLIICAISVAHAFDPRVARLGTGSPADGTRGAINKIEDRLAAIASVGLREPV